MAEPLGKKTYKVDDIKVSIKYERPGVHIVTIEPPSGRDISEEEGKRITKLIEEKTVGNPVNCTCIDSSIKLHLEGALEHYIKDVRGDVVRSAAAAVECKERNPVLSQHYLAIVESQKGFIEKLEESKNTIKALPVCKES